jgi:hypothetical protein
MSTPLFVVLVAVLVVGVLGIVAICSLLENQPDGTDLRSRLGREANPAGERDDLLPGECEGR